ncbi:MAG: signal peptidase II [Methylococcaceae bacterium]|nr:signal peptidase II [Methylococcaceae bacterium]
MLIWLWLSALVIVIDQITKRVVDSTMQLYQSIELIPYFQLTYMRNQGAAFSFLSGAGGWQRWFFIGLAVIASVFICFWLKKLNRSQRWEAIAWSLVLGGALGNLIDRILYGYVIDFLDVYIGDWHWPAFNVADSAITLGVAMLLLDSFKPQPRSLTE